MEAVKPLEMCFEPKDQVADENHNILRFEAAFVSRPSGCRGPLNTRLLVVSEAFLIIFFTGSFEARLWRKFKKRFRSKNYLEIA
jgi:hypothetical protein